MDIFALLTAQHRQAKALLDELAAGEDLSRRERAELLVELQALLIAHHHAEETVAYNALAQDRTTAELARVAQLEHERVEGLLAALSDERDEDRWRESLEELRKRIEGHIEHEELEVFSALRRNCDARTLDRMLDYARVDRARAVTATAQ